MASAVENISLEELGIEEQHKLAAACLKNRWLSRGITIDHHNTTPLIQKFSFLNSESLEGLLEYFRSGPHVIREGVVYRDLAFVQQVDMGDEWLVLKREFDSETGEAFWLPFESYSFDRIVESSARFECAVSALRDADAFEIAALFSRTPSRQRQARSIS